MILFLIIGIECLAPSPGFSTDPAGPNQFLLFAGPFRHEAPRFPSIEQLEEDLSAVPFRGLSAFGMKRDRIYFSDRKKSWRGEGFIGLDGTLWQGHVGYVFSSSERFLMEIVGKSRAGHLG